MIRHIVIWRLKEQALGRNRWENARIGKEMLESLGGRIPGLLKLDVGIDLSRGGSSGDLVLVSDFEDRAALEGYQSHPEHERVGQFISEVRSERIVVDYEV